MLRSIQVGEAWVLRDKKLSVSLCVFSCAASQKVCHLRF
jgi:hypothetical protein